MKAKNIVIKNFRSIENIEICLSQTGSFHTYGLIGVNEAGKSSILNALKIFHDLEVTNPKDFRDKTKPIEVTVEFVMNDSEWSELQTAEANNLADLSTFSIAANLLIVKVVYKKGYEDNADWTAFVECHGYEPKQISLENISYDVNFWTADKKYLISQPIDLSAFATKPYSTSVPLLNCFNIAGYTNIKNTIEKATDSTEIEALEEQLGTEVTKHINDIWPNHPIIITFKIINQTINFHVKDKGVRGVAKTAEQRSDGFKQFISFLLTISAENVNKSLDDTIVLIDEPETHLHPQAQLFFLEELKRISKDNNNTVIFSTHSNYMIDRENINHYFRVAKKNGLTEIAPIEKSQSSYSSVNYHVFDIESNDYFIELYSKLFEIYIDGANDEDDRKRREAQTSFNENFFASVKRLTKNKPYKGKENVATLPFYIRNCIHHPESGNTFTRDELRKATDKLIEFLDQELIKD